jgi:phospholipase/carboxylesterase
MSAANASPHTSDEVLQRGEPLRTAKSALVLLHGRGGSAEDIISLGAAFALSQVALLAPQAADHTWYPNSFLAPIPSNEPWLSSAVQLVTSIVEGCIRAGVPPERVALLGFSQGACLACEVVARHPRRYGALIAFTGGLIGPLGMNLQHDGSLSGTPILLSSGDPDPHVPWSRVEETAQQFGLMGGEVQLQRYPGRPHTVLREELEAAGNLISTYL